MRPGAERWLSVVSVGTFVVVWELVCRAAWVSPVLLSPPSQVAVVGATLVAQPRLWSDLLYTATAFGAALAIAVVGGAALGVLIGYSRAAYFAVNPFIVVINALPKVVLMPLVVLWVGIGTTANVLLGAVMASFPILTATYAGIRSLERDYVRLARSFGATPRVIFRTIVVPGVVPYLISGLRVGLNYAMVGVLISEFFGSSLGLGYRMMLLMANFEVASFFVYLVVVAIFTLGASALLHILERRVQRWRPDPFAATRGM
ncbi:MAG: ABC transporter permease [Nannocystaceae bacterium]|nr:ABC transporter permease [Nannocystaceae bacterium]